MRSDQQEVAAAFRAVLFLAFLAAAGMPAWSVEGAGGTGTVTEGIEIGGSVSNSTINNTINKQDPAVLAATAKTFAEQMAATTEAKAQAEAKSAELATKLGFTSAAVGEFFKILGEREVPEEKVPARLIEIATHFAQTRDQLAAIAPDDPHTAELARRAKEALDGGRLTEADALLDQAKEGELAVLRQARELKQKAQEAEDRHALNAVAFIASRGNIALTQLRYADAAEHFKHAASLVPLGHPEVMAYCLDSEALALYAQGENRVDIVALKEAIATWHVVLQHYARDRVPLDWADTQNKLGATLLTLGGLENDTALLREAVAAFHATLEEITRDRVPLAWARVQDNLGNALEALGKRENSTALLREAVAAQHAALEEITRDRVPLAWARTQNNLGYALFGLGELESGTARLEEAVAAYHAALEVWTRDREPHDWAIVHHNLGDALEALGARDNGTAYLTEAVAAWEACLTVTPSTRPQASVQEVHSHIDQARAEIARRTAK
jgi:tetratricopeptide (TPR) repeat protein